MKFLLILLLLPAACLAQTFRSDEHAFRVVKVVEGLEQTNESVISHRQADVLRLLTVFTVIVLPLTFITGVFGMNVAFPGEGTHEAFWAILVGLVAVLAGMVGFFRWKRWL